jgi:hypothetical protein
MQANSQYGSWRLSWRALLVAFSLSWPALSVAQPAPPPAPEPSATPPADAPGDSDLGAPDLAGEVAAQKQAIAELRGQVEDLSFRLDEAAMAEPPDDTSELLKIYGFMDVGFQRLFMDDELPLSTIFNSANASSFVVGNLNVYLDAQPVPGWRGLLEVRFTNAPHGEIESLGGLTGTPFRRTSTMNFDQHSATANSYNWGGYVAIERAHIDWTQVEWFKLRVGSFFTPFGIWNIDHGTPTLIPLTLPQLIVSFAFPARQTGIQIYGNQMVDEWELGYAATVSNGRSDVSHFAFDDDRAFGGRLYANLEDGEFVLKFGLSGYIGWPRDNEVNVVGIVPTVTVEADTTFEGREMVAGVDVSIDLGPTRIRAEAIVKRVEYEEGKRPAGNPLLAPPGAFVPDSKETAGYVMVAHQLPFLKLEPFAMIDFIHAPTPVAELFMVYSVGFNVRFNPAVTWKTQFGYVTMYDVHGTEPALAPEKNNLGNLASRLVLVF